MVSFISRLGFRLGVIAALALTIFTVGKIADIVSPPEAVANEQIPLVTGGLAAPLSDPTMARALAQLRNSGSLGSGPFPGAKLTFPSPTGPVTLTPDDLTLLNARYREMRRETAEAGGEYAQLREDLRREQLANDGWGESSY
ncbi:MAG: hypothetical protein HKO08_11360 [Erythrobacter sp.]|nr:hypothetical protein [Erythrobacter sp.]